jgi:hypothetical protein
LTAAVIAIVLSPHAPDLEMWELFATVETAGTSLGHPRLKVSRE